MSIQLMILCKNSFFIGCPFLSCEDHVWTYKTLSDSIHASYSTHPQNEQIYNLNNIYIYTTSHKWEWLFIIQIKNVDIYTSQYSIAANFNILE